MKKVWRAMTFVVVLALLCTSLCGCTVIDEMKKEQAIYTDEDTILWNGVEYYMLPTSLTMMPQRDDMFTPIYVTEADVPVLISGLFGQESYSCNDGMLLEVTGYSTTNILDMLMDASSEENTDSVTDEEDITWEETKYYCRAENYETVKAAIEAEWNGTLVYDTYSYTVYEYDFYSGEGETHRRLLTDEQVQAYCRTIEDAVVAEGLDEWQVEYLVTVNAETADGLFCGDVGYDIYRYTGAAKTSYFLYDYDYECYYVVADEYTDLFTEMVAPAVEAMEAMSAWYDEEYFY